MPLYDYRCTECGRRFERLQPNAEAPHPKCPDCGKETEKLLTAPGGIHMKQPGSASSASGHDRQACCGMSEPCDSPKRCCGQ